MRNNDLIRKSLLWKTSCPSWPPRKLNSIKTHRGKDPPPRTPPRSAGPSFTWLCAGPRLQPPGNGKSDTQQQTAHLETSLKAKMLTAVFNSYYSYRKGILSREMCLLFYGNILSENVWVYHCFEIISLSNVLSPMPYKETTVCIT